VIVWLASYPRSGNTLLRTILFNTMRLDSASDEVGEAKIVGLTEAARHNTGVVEIGESWEDFYTFASESERVFLVKTHRAPRDDQPAIYVVRDGRKACLSYSRFHERFTPSPYPGLLELVLGDDFYGSWSDHYRIWAKRPNTLVVRFEELIDARDELCATLAEKVRYSGPVSSWLNPFDELHKENPDFFRAGESSWQGDTTWTEMIDAAFFQLHGDLMVELGYASNKEARSSSDRIPEGWMDIANVTRQLIADKKRLQGTCDARQIVIDELKRECDHRLELIHKLSVSAK
jgi:hypothetical protein